MLKLAKTANHAFFTGNTQYYDALIKINDLIRQNNLDFSQNVETRVRWLNMREMFTRLNFRLTPAMHQDLLKKLNILYQSAGDDEMREFLKQFIPLGRTLDAPKFEEPTLDELGRSFTVASRKTARAQAYLVPGSGLLYVNGGSMADYFSLSERLKIIKAFEMTGLLGKFNVWALVQGGGTSGQADALSVAISRGICVHDPSTREALDERNCIDADGMTKIDRRQVERKKTGQPKARKKVQWVKR